MSELGRPASDVDLDAHAALSEFEPVPRIGVVQAAQRYWYLVVAPVIVFVIIAGILASARVPTYTAEARLIVGRLDLRPPERFRALRSSRGSRTELPARDQC